MELKYLYTLKKIVETGSFQKAAIALNYSQSTVTYQINQLETELGTKLFERSGHKMLLTQSGKEILPKAEKVLQAVDELICYNNGNQLKGTLNIAVAESLMTYKLGPVLKEFKSKAPNIKLSIHTLNCYTIYEEMLSGRYDIAIHHDVKPYPEYINVKRIGCFPCVMVASPDVDKKLTDFVSPNQRKEICHIKNDNNAIFIKMLNKYLKEQNIVFDSEMELWSIEAIKQSVINNLGVAFLPKFTVEKELIQCTLTEIETGIENNVINSVCVHNKNRWQSPAANLFLNIVQEYFKDK